MRQRPRTEPITRTSSQLVDGHRHPATTRLETELLVEADSALVVDIHVERELRAACFPCSLRSAVDQPATETRTTVRLADVDIADDQPIRAIENRWCLVDLGRDEAHEVAVGGSEVGIVSRTIGRQPVDGDPRSIVRLVEPIESERRLLGDEIGLLGEYVAVDGRFEVAMIGKP